MNWYAVYTKRGQEGRALANLTRQGITCYLPVLRVQKVVRGVAKVVLEPLFSRYLFVQFDPGGGWSALRSTRGVTRLVTVGNDPAPVDERLIEVLRAHEAGITQVPLFEAGEPIRVTSGPFCGIEGVYLMADGESRAMVLVQILNKPTKLPVRLGQLKRLSI